MNSIHCIELPRALEDALVNLVSPLWVLKDDKIVRERTAAALYEDCGGTEAAGRIKDGKLTAEQAYAITALVSTACWCNANGKTCYIWRGQFAGDARKIASMNASRAQAIRGLLSLGFGADDGLTDEIAEKAAEMILRG